MPTTVRDGFDIESPTDVEVPNWFDNELRSDLIKKVNRQRGLLSFVDTLVIGGHTKRYNWSEITRIIEEDCQQVYDYKFSPDIVVGIKSGGAFIAKYVSGCLGVNKVGYLRVDRYNPVLGSAFLAVVFKYYRQARLTPTSSLDLRNRHVLVVDDQIRSGKSLDLARRWIEAQGAAEVKTFCLFTQGAKADFGNRPELMIDSPWGDDP